MDKFIVICFYCGILYSSENNYSYTHTHTHTHNGLPSAMMKEWSKSQKETYIVELIYINLKNKQNFKKNS